MSNQFHDAHGHIVNLDGGPIQRDIETAYPQWQA